MPRGKKNQQVIETDNRTVLSTVKNLDQAKVIDDVNKLQVSIQGTLANVSASITYKLSQMEQIDKAIQLKQDRLKELYGVEEEAMSLDDFRAIRESERTEWNNERDRLQVEDNEAEQARIKRQTREEEDWMYTFNQTKRRTEAEQKNIEQILQKAWAEREAALKTKEQEFADLKKEVEGLDARVKAEVAKAEAVIANSLKRQHQHELELVKRDSGSAESVAAMRITSLTEQVNAREKQIAELQVQLQAARNDAKDVATQALSAQSERNVAQALRGVVESNRESSGKQK